jgi:hypothetical protein
MTRKQHCEECLLKLGEPFNEVHAWLDEFQGKPPHGMRHRKFRHHQKGIEEVRKMWGGRAAEAATLHIVSDLKMEGWDPEKDKIPYNQGQYEEMGLF